MNEDKIECGICGAKCQSIKDYQAHMDSHIGEDRSKYGQLCPYCTLFIPNTIGLDLHLNDYHKEE